MKYFLIVLLFIPIPLIIKVKYENKLSVFIFNKEFKIKNHKKVKINKRAGKRKSGKKIKLIWKPYIKINIDMLYGLDDAAITAISYGLIFSVLPLIKGFLNKFFHVKSFSQDIKIDYNRKIFNLYIKCIILINIAQIIINLIYLLYYNFKRGGFNGKSSNRQSNEEYHGKP